MNGQNELPNKNYFLPIIASTRRRSNELYFANKQIENRFLHVLTLVTGVFVLKFDILSESIDIE